MEKEKKEAPKECRVLHTANTHASSFNVLEAMARALRNLLLHGCIITVILIPPIPPLASLFLSTLLSSGGRLKR